MIRRFPGWFYRALDVGMIAYGLFLGLWVVLRLLVSDRFWWLALLNYFAIILFAPLALLIPIAIWRRRWWNLVALALPVAAFAWLYGGLLVPKQPPVAPAERTFTMMSFNVLWKNKEYERIARVIEENDPAIIALLELRPEHIPNIQAALNERFPYEAYVPGEQYHTVGLLSRHPIESVTPLANPPFERALLVRLRIDDQPLSVVVAHLTPTNMLSNGVRQMPAVVEQRFAERVDQARYLAALAQSEGQPMIVACDCNFTSTTAAYDEMLDVFHDSFAEAGWGFGYTLLDPYLDIPALRLDYVWHTPELTALGARVGADAGSDHLPMVVRMALP